MASQTRRSAALISLLGALVLVLLMTLPATTSGEPAARYLEVTANGTVPAGELEQVIADCPADYHVTGGGFQLASINQLLQVHQNIPVNPDSNGGVWGWAVSVVNDSPVNVNFLVIALCAKG